MIEGRGMPLGDESLVAECFTRRDLGAAPSDQAAGGAPNLSRRWCRAVADRTPEADYCQIKINSSRLEHSALPEKPT